MQNTKEQGIDKEADHTESVHRFSDKQAAKPPTEWKEEALFK